MRTLQSILRIIAVSASILMAAASELRASVDYGLKFRSFETTPSERTSLVLNAASGKPVEFKDSLRLTFSLKANSDISKFGYICRALLNGEQAVDILLYTPSNSPTAICATGDHMNMIRIPLKNNSWQELSLLLLNGSDSCKAVLNGQLVAAMATKGSTAASGRGTDGSLSATFAFGQSNLPDFETSDVASMVIQDLRIRKDRQKEKLIRLENEKESNSHRGYSLQTVNPIWLRECNSSWNEVATLDMPSVTQICTDPAHSKIYFISDKTVSEYDLRRMSASQWVCSHDIKASLTTNDFIILPDGTLAYLDIDVPRLIRFDAARHDWEQDNPRTKRSLHLHHNMLYNPADGRYIQMFGYGQHRYFKDIRIWDPATNSVEIHEIRGMDPRYLAAADLSDGKIYVFGGKGNSQGAQELGAQLYNDLTVINLNDLSIGEVVTIDGLSNEVAAADMIAERNSESFLALTYNPKSYHTSLQLKRFRKDGRTECFGQSLPYDFLDVESSARLIYDSTSQNYYAIYTEKDGAAFKARILSIQGPLLCAPQGESGKSAFLPWIIVMVLLCCGALCMILCVTLRRRRSAERKQPQSGRNARSTEARHPKAVHTARETKAPGVYLLGGFKVIAADGEDISANFSPLMKQLLSLLILNSGTHDGISNARLKDTLWFDKTDESYNNNRGVTLKKIRTELAKVGGSISIITYNNRWRLDDPEGLCDFIGAERKISAEGTEVPEITDIALKGTLLPDMRTEWLDAYKGRYEDSIISRLSHQEPDLGTPASAKLAGRIADAILIFDNLDENAVKMKCKSLTALHHNGTAKRTFDSFCENYERTLGEKFSTNFSDFINN